MEAFKSQSMPKCSMPDHTGEWRPFTLAKPKAQCRMRPSAPCASQQWKHEHKMEQSTASRLLGGLAAGTLLLQPAAAWAVEAASSSAASNVGIAAGVNAVLYTQQQSLDIPLPSEQAPAVAGLAPVETAAAVDAAPAAAEPAAAQRQISSPQAAASGRRAFFDVTVDGEPRGRIVVQLYRDVPVGAARFADLAQGKQGVGFRRTKFDAVNQDFVRDAGLRQLNFGSEQETPIAGGDGVNQLEVELEAAGHRHTGSGDVSLEVRSDKPLETKEKLVAYRGQLVKVQETLGEKANGTRFVITLKAVPSLDATNLVVGRVVEGMDVVQHLSELPAVKDNRDSGYIKTAKFIGDRRADVAVRAFGRPFNKVVVAECGLLD